jgi:hypothetical protein
VEQDANLDVMEEVEAIRQHPQIKQLRHAQMVAVDQTSQALLVIAMDPTEAAAVLMGKCSLALI